jgi:thiol-disulfide isomerase/thioredoxin
MNLAKCLQFVSIGAVSMMTLVSLSISQAVPTAAKPASSSTSVAQNQAIAGLAAHLRKINAKMYGAYWCPHCKHQKDMFGDDGFRPITYIECDPKGTNAKPDLCRAANIKGYPTWEIKGKFYPGTQSLEELATLSGYQGNTKF